MFDRHMRRAGARRVNVTKELQWQSKGYTKNARCTRKEHGLRRRDVEATRRLIIGLTVVGVLFVGLIAAGLIQELVLKPHQPVATVDGTSITSQDYAKRVLFSWYQSGQPVQDPQSSSIQVLDQMIDDVLIREQAKAKGITVTGDEVTEAVEKNFGYYRVPPTPFPTATAAPTATPAPSPTPGGEPTATPAPTFTPYPTSTPVTLESYQDTYKQYLTRLQDTTGMTEADFRHLVETDLLRQKLYDQLSATVPTTEEQIQVSHILVAIRTPAPTPVPTATGQPSPTPLPTGAPTPAPTPTPLPERTEDQALASIDEIQSKLVNGGDFGELAKEYSDDTGSAAQGGDLGWIGRNEGLDTTFENAAFALEVGQVSGPVKTQFGFHLIKVTAKDPKRDVPAYTLQQRQYEAYTAWLSDLNQQATVTRNWSLDKVPPTPAALASQ